MGHIVGISGRLESALGWLMAFMTRGSATITVAMFHAVASTDAQRAMLMAAANHALQGQELAAFNDLMDDFRSRYGERSRLIHNIWGHSTDHPDKALWWRSADLGSSLARIAASADYNAMQQISFNEDLSLKAMTYTVQDLQDAASRLDDYRGRVTNFVMDIWNNHPALAAQAIASTSAPPAGAEPQLDLPQNPQTPPLSDQPGDPPKS